MSFNGNIKNNNDKSNNSNNINKMIIIGSGPAGLTSAIYTARGGIEPIVMSGDQPGGQLMLTSEVENFPGFKEPILGPDLMENMRNQAKRLGTKFIDNTITSVNFSSFPFKVNVLGDSSTTSYSSTADTDNNNSNQTSYFAESVIIATGASAMWLGLESENRLKGKGVSSCATCDGFFFKGKDVVVVGGGDTAIEEALFLAKLANKVTVIHRRNELRAMRILQQRAFNNPKISFIWNTIVEEILGENKVEGIKIKNVINEEKAEELKCDGVFIAIGHKPNTDIFRGQIEIDNRGYIKRYDESKTNIEGIFVAGDVYDYRYRQAVTAAGSGCKSALDAITFLETKPQ